MSRHRNVRNLIDEEDYDDYGDDYDDYDDGYTGGTSSLQQQPLAGKKKKKKKGKAVAVAVVAPTTTPPNQSSNVKAAIPAASASASSIMTPPPAQNNTTTTASSNNENVATAMANSSMMIPTQSGELHQQQRTTMTTTTTTAPPRPPPGFAAISKSVIPVPPPPHAAEPAALRPPPVVPAELLNNADDTGTNDNNNDSNNNKPLLTVVVLGHVDAGKSTVTGHLLHLVAEQQQQQQKKKNNTTTTNNSNNGSSTLSPNHRHKLPVTATGTRRNTTTTTNTTNFAWLLDEDEQERKHGVTMDIAVKSLTLPHIHLLFLDAPGHADYVPAMITGTASADAAILVVDISDNSNSSSSSSSSHNNNNHNSILQKGQLQEHVYLAKGLGVQQILVLINKMDVVGYDNAILYQAVEAQLLHFLVYTAGYPAHRVHCVPVSGLSGVNIVRKQNSNNNNNNNEVDDPERQLRQWYDGPTVVEALDALDIVSSLRQKQSKLLERPLRMVVTDVVEGSNAISVRVKIVAGWVKAGEKLMLLPVGDTVSLTKVQSVHSQHTISTMTNNHNNNPPRTVFGSGELLDATMTGLSDAQRIAPGSLLARPDSRPPLASRCRARLFVLDITIPLIRGATTMFHLHQLDIPCHLTSLLQCTMISSDGTTVQKDFPRALTKNTSAVVEIQLSVPIAMEAYADCRALGRFVLRRNGESVAVGRIEQVLLA
jgi:elongation factor 1 alpha-like protein